jgi:hypothetical protein
MKPSCIRAGRRAARHGVKTTAMLVEVPAATFVTLAHRLPMLLAAALDPKARDNPELRRMIVEKARAGFQSAGAVGGGVVRPPVR